MAGMLQPVALLGATLLLSGCLGAGRQRSHEVAPEPVPQPPQRAEQQAAAATVPAPVPSTSPLTPPAATSTAASPHFVAIELGSLPTAILWRPPGAHHAPLVVSAHGAGGTPEWHCNWLSSVLASDALVVCLRGKRMNRDIDAFYYPEHHTLGAVFDAATEKVQHVYAEQLDSKRRVYVGYSQGATMGALMMLDRKPPFPLLLLIEGGYGHWTNQRCRNYARSGGQKVFFACGTTTCNQAAVTARQRLERAGVQARVAYAPGAGHTPAGNVGALAEQGLAWLLE